MSGTAVDQNYESGNDYWNLTNHSLSGQQSEWDHVVFEEWSKFQIRHDQCTHVLDKIETALLIAGLVGNILALVTLLSGNHMRTPSFIYHKALVSAYLIYCLNFLIVKYVNTFLTVPSERRQLRYYSAATAYYAAILNRVVTSVCGYLVLYTSSAISIDRFLALVEYRTYSKFNRKCVAYMWVGASLILSVCFHSWSPWLENEIQKEKISVNNQSMITYRHRESINRGLLQPYLKAKDWYNLIIRFAYAIELTVLSFVVMYMFFRQQAKKISLCKVPKKRIRRERSLFYLMIAVVIIAYIQVIPRESKRVMELIYPPEYVAHKTADQSLSIESRRTYLLFGLYGYTFTKPILNLCTAIERSLLFYLYFALNHSFRREVLTVLRLRQVWRNVLVKLGSIKNVGSVRLQEAKSGDGAWSERMGQHTRTGLTSLVTSGKQFGEASGLLKKGKSEAAEDTTVC